MVCWELYQLASNIRAIRGIANAIAVPIVFKISLNTMYNWLQLLRV